MYVRSRDIRTANFGLDERTTADAGHDIRQKAIRRFPLKINGLKMSNIRCDGIVEHGHH